MISFPKFESVLTYETEYAIVPVPKQSARFGKGRVYRDAKKDKYVKKLQRHFKKTFPYPGLFEGPVSAKVLFVFPIPKKHQFRLTGDRDWYCHLTTPDKDNLLKPLFDAMSGTVWVDDKYVFHKEVLAVVAKTPKISVEINLCKLPKKSILGLQ